MTVMDIQPLISIITVSLNSEKTISRTMESVLRQTFHDYEYWIIDGASTDHTIDIIKRYEPKFEGRLHYISEKDTGMYNAINKGIKKCTGKIIGILNSDDYYSEDTFESLSEIWNVENCDNLIISGDMVRVSHNDEEIYRYHFTEQQIKNRSCFGHPSMFASRMVYETVGLYDESYRWAADGEWQYRAHENANVRWVLCPRVFNHMREGGASDNSKYRWVWFKERVRMKKAHNRGSLLKIYIQEFKSVIRTDIKAIMPKRWMGIVYRMKYGK